MVCALAWESVERAKEEGVEKQMETAIGDRQTDKTDREKKRVCDCVARMSGSVYTPVIFMSTTVRRELQHKRTPTADWA